MTEALEQAFDKSGISVIREPEKLSGVLELLLPGDDFRFERMFLTLPAQLPEWGKLYSAHISGDYDDRRKTILILEDRLVDILGWARDRADMVLDCYVSALSWQNVSVETAKSSVLYIRSRDGKMTSFDRPVSADTGKHVITDRKGGTYDNSRGFDPGNLTIGSMYLFGGFYWRVIRSTQHNAVLLADEIIVSDIAYHTGREQVTWENSSLRHWLNNEFYENFSKYERDTIINVTVTTRENPWTGVRGGNTTRDRVYLLDIHDVIRIFGNSGDIPNRHKKAADGSVGNENAFTLYDCYNYFRTARLRGKSGWWWLRTPGKDGQTALVVAADGSINLLGTDVYSLSAVGGVRPCITIKK
jgi:hypothetical protein